MKDRNRGFSLIELLIVMAIILVICAIAIPSLMRSKMSANEASAVGSLHAINTACQSYATTYQIGFPATLSSLGPASSPSSAAADLLDTILAAGAKSGYSFTFSAGTAVNGIINDYALNADPLQPGTTGQRGFYTDQSLVIRESASGSASVTDSPIQ